MTWFFGAPFAGPIASSLPLVNPEVRTIRERIVTRTYLPSSRRPA